MIGVQRDPRRLPGGSTCLSWADPSHCTTSGGFVTGLTDSRGLVFVAPSAPDRPAYSATGLSGKPCFTTDAVQQYLGSPVADTVLATALGGGDDTAFTAILAFQYTGSLTPVGYSPRIFALAGGVGNASFFSLAVLETTGEWTCSKRANTGGTVVVTGLPADANAHIFAIVHTGTTVTVYDETLTTILTGVQNVGAMTLEGVMFGQVATLSGTDFAAAKFGRWALFSGALSTADLTRQMRGFRNRYGI